MSLRTRLARVPAARRAYDYVASIGDRIAESRRPPIPEIGPDDWPTPAVRRDIASLRRSNLLSRRSVIDPESPVVVTMTTHGPRIKSVYLAIESVARGDLRPRRHILYLDDHRIAARLPRSVRRLMRRGLEVVEVPPGMKVHTKHYFYVHGVDRHEHLLATNEDDILFPPDWLSSMVATLAEHPDSIVTPRAHRIVLDENGVAPYSTWVPASDTLPSFLNFGTTVSGQIYPPAFLDYVRDAGDDFLRLCPNNDDLWLHHLAVQSGRRVVQVRAEAQHFPFVPGTQAGGLWVTNIVGGENDRQIAATYDHSDVAKFRADERAGY